MKWIWLDYIEKNQYADFVFDYDSKGGNSCIKISSCGEYTLFVNGKFVSCGQYNSYPDKKYYDKIFFKSKKGKNRIAIIGFLPNENTCNELADNRGIAFEIEVDGVKYESNENVLSRKSIMYESGETFKITGNIGFSIHCDLSKKDNFYELEAELNGFSTSCVTGIAEVLERPIKKLSLEKKNGIIKNAGFFLFDEYKDIALQMQNSYLSTKRIDYFTKDTTFPYTINCDEQKNIFIIVDMQRETTGYINLDIDVYQDTQIEYCWGEHLDDLHVRAEISGRRFAGSVKLKKGNNKYTEYFCRLGLRYLMLFIHSNKLVVNECGLIECYYPNERINLNFKNYLEQKIYDVSVHTLECCMHEHYEDCPWREQSQYVMDSRNQILAGFYSFKNLEFVEASIRLMFAKIYDDGNIPLMQPSDYILRITNFSLASILVVKDYCCFTKDYSLALELWDEIEFIIDKFSSRINEKYLWQRCDDNNQWNFFEWTDRMANAFGDNPLTNNSEQYALPSQAFMILAFDAYCFIGKKLKKNCERIHLLSKKIKETSNKFFFDEKEKVYCTYNTDGIREHYAELTNILAIYSGICPKKYIKDIINKIIDKKSNLQKMSLSNYLYKYEVLLSFGNKYKKYVREEIQKVWGGMLFNNATSFFEVEEGADAFYYAGSLCHGWSAIPAYIYGKFFK